MTPNKGYSIAGIDLSEDKWRKRIRYPKLLLVLSSLIIIVFPIVYSFSPAQNSDYVEDVIWAETAISAGRLLNPDFVYPYAIPFGGNLFVLPFVHIFGISQIANSCGIVLFYLVFLGTGALFFSSLTNSKMVKLTGMAILVLAFRSAVGANQLHHILYYQLGNICLLGILAGLFYFFIQNNKKKSVFCLIVYGIWAGANGPITIVLSIVPVFLALFCLLILRKAEKKRIFQFALYLIGVIVLGLALYFFAIRGIQDGKYLENAGSYSFQEIKTWFENLRHLPEDWFRLFVLYGPEGNRITTIYGIETLISIGCGCFIGLLPLIFLYKLFSRRCTDVELLSFIVDIAVWCICLMQYVFFRSENENRVLFNGVLSHFILLAIWFTERNSIRRNRNSTVTKSLLNRVYVFTTVFVLMAGYSVWFVAKAEWNINSGTIEFLQDHKLEYGFSTYWNSHINTVNSGGKVIIRPVSIANGNVKSMEYQCEDSWYLSDQIDQNGKWFILLEQSEWEKMHNEINSVAIELAEEDININGFHILIYTADLWDDIIQRKHFIYNFNNNSWQNNCEMSQGIRLISDGGVSFGPYIPVSEGDIVHVKITGSELAHAIFNTYEWGNDAEINISNIIITNDIVSFDIIPDHSISSLEISITNPTGDDYIDCIQLFSEEIIVEKINGGQSND